jgi:hypothetical protein
MKIGIKHIAAFAIVVTGLIALLGAQFWPVYNEMQAMKVPHYEQGEHKGALFCAQCHRKIYDDWSAHSVHAVATTRESFNNYLIKFKENIYLDTIVGEAVCFACHGKKNSSEGVNCEICHGTVISNLPIRETHKKKYKPGLKELQKKDFCAKCHNLRSPLSGDGILTVQDEWRNSKAANQGKTCQSCHMYKGAEGLSNHGFDSAYRDVTIYRDDLRIKNVELNFPHFKLALENRVNGHAIPASGPTRVMVLEINFFDSMGKEQYQVREIFGKKFKLMPVAGLFPNSLLKNTQLQSGEMRSINFTLPNSLEGKINKAVATLKFYSISDELQGDINRAHWISMPILVEKFSF